MSYICKYCKKEFTTKSSLTSHENHFCTLNNNKTNIKKTTKIIKAYVNCPYCNKKISKSNINKHIQSHENGNWDKYNNKKYHLDHKDLFCKFCGKEYKNKNGLRTHESRCNLNPNKVCDFSSQNNPMYGRIPWNKGLTKDTDERLLKASEKCKQTFANKQIISIYKEHNDNEIQKWFHYLNIIKETLIIPKYITKIYNNRTVITECDDFSYALDKWHFESDYLMNVVCNKTLVNTNTIHHIDNNSLNNDLTNLMIFKNKGCHNRFHHSNYAYLIYDENTHIFDCILKK